MIPEFLVRRSRLPSMARHLALLACLVAVLLPTGADACRSMGPSMATLDGYHSIFVGHVTGLHLQGYENALLGKPDLVHPELGNLTITNGASLVSVRVAVTLSIRGPMSGPVELRLAGCTFDLPEFRERGIFFVQPGGTSTVVAWEDDADYETWLGRLGVAQDDR